MTEGGAAAGASTGARVQPVALRQRPRNSAEPMAANNGWIMSVSLWFADTGVSPHHQPDNPVQAQLHFQKRSLYPVHEGDVKGALREFQDEGIAPGRQFLGGNGRALRGPLVNRFRQRLPQTQLHLEPRPLRLPMEYHWV